ncbi:MAG: hypothetical protein CL467_05700 [Acidimicrobiaceae bacterium]|nr:hypothetical protein [Acidimicrobiaceae bacterium]|tara:strand:+ start:5399 stop:6334 length:936 start_codon:yes stop_codon:yes gene_type:complete
MIRYLAFRIGSIIPVLFGMSILVFLILHLIPGDPAQAILLGVGSTADDVQMMRELLGLEDPLWEQYFRYLGGLVQGDLGTSFLYNQPVAEKVVGLIPDTLILTACALGFALMVGIPTGVSAAIWHNRPVDRIAMGISAIGIALPAFWLAVLLTRYFSVKLGWFPSLGTGSIKALVLPVVSLGWPLSSILSRLIRESLIEVRRSPYVIAARSRGYSGIRILVRHSIRKAAGPVVSMIGLQFGGVIAGAVAIEFIFGRPGLGSYLVESMTAKDIPAVQGIIMTIGAVYLLTNLIVDLVRAGLEPSVRDEWANR